MEIFISLIIGGLVVLAISTYVKHLKNKKRVSSQSIILLDKIKKVCKFNSRR